MEIENEVESLAPEASRQPNVVWQAREPARPIGDDHLVEVRAMGYHRRGRWLDQIGQVCAGIATPECLNRRCREHDVANQPKANQQDFQSGWTSCGQANWLRIVH